MRVSHKCGRRKLSRMARAKSWVELHLSRRWVPWKGWSISRVVRVRSMIWSMGSAVNWWECIVTSDDTCLILLWLIYAFYAKLKFGKLVKMKSSLMWMKCFHLSQVWRKLPCLGRLRYNSIPFGVQFGQIRSIKKSFRQSWTFPNVSFIVS